MKRCIYFPNLSRYLDFSIAVVGTIGYWIATSVNDLTQSPEYMVWGTPPLQRQRIVYNRRKKRTFRQKFYAQITLLVTSFEPVLLLLSHEFCEVLAFWNWGLSNQRCGVLSESRFVCRTISSILILTSSTRTKYRFHIDLSSGSGFMN